MLHDEDKHPLLKRFRAEYARLDGGNPPVRLYALIDFAPIAEKSLTWVDGQLANVTRYPLYADTGLDSLSKTGPFLIACPDPIGDEPLTLSRFLYRLAEQDHRIVSWIWSAQDIVPLIGHLQSLLHARLEPENEDAWFFFYQPSYLPVLHRELPEATRRYMFGPCVAWWSLDARGELIELAGEAVPIPSVCDALPIPRDVIDALHREGAPVQTRAWLKKAMPGLLSENNVNTEIQKLAPLVDRAFDYGITDKMNLGVYAAFGLRYGAEYDDHPALQEVLTQFRDTKPALIDAYAALGEKVWIEVEHKADRSAEEAAVLAHQAKLRKYGYASMRVKIINNTEHWRRDIKLVPPRESYASASSLGEVSAAVYRAIEAEVPKAHMPLPGMRAVVKWIGSAGWECTGEAVVEGELPQAEGAGFAIIEFARNYRVYITMHAEEPKLKT